MRHPFESELAAHYRRPAFKDRDESPGHLQTGATGASLGWADSVGRPELAPLGEWSDAGEEFLGSPDVIGSELTETTYRGLGPANAGRTDERLREMICERLMEDDFVDPGDVSVQVREGEVTLEGTVAERYMKRRIEELVDSFNDVKEIHNRLRVAPPPDVSNMIA